MRSAIASIVLFVLMIICMVFALNYLSRIDTVLESSSMKIETALDTGNFKKAQTALYSFKKQWQNHVGKISIFTNHNELDEINTELSELNKHIYYKNKEESLVSINIIRNILQSITDMEKINFKNLF